MTIQTTSRLQFDEARHLYTLDGKPLTGVTTILGMISKPSLIQWAANQTADYILENIEEETTIAGLPYYVVAHSVIAASKKAHALKKDKAADTGTIAHKWIEDWINGLNPKRDPSVSKMTDRFVEWAEKNDVKFLASEKRVYSEKHWYAGTLDFLCQMNGLTYLGDLKTSSNIYDDYFFQTSAYQQALEENEPEIKIDGHIIVNCQKNGRFQTKESFDYHKNLEAFMGALAIYRRKRELENYK